MTCPNPPTAPEQVGAQTREGARAMYESSPHLIACPNTTPPYQWIYRGWCKTRCRNGQWTQKSPRLQPRAKGKSSHNLITHEVNNV